MKRRTGDVKLSKRETIIRKIDTREEDAGGNALIVHLNFN